MDTLELKELPIPTYTTDVHSGELHQIFQNLEYSLHDLTRRVQRHRDYQKNKDKEQPDQKHKTRKHCQTVCAKLNGVDRARCKEQCLDPVVSFEHLENLSESYPIDIQRMRTDLELKHTFERHQKHPESIANTNQEASTISDLYAMPVSTLALPEESWSRSMEVITEPENLAQMKMLVQNWLDRARNYPPEAQEELLKKLARHDRDDVISDELAKMTNDVYR